MNQTVSQVIAGSLDGLGVKVLTYVPGTGVNEVFVDFNQVSGQTHAISFHEEVAYTIAHGASLMGVRSAALMKAHGLIKAGNSVIDSLFCGTTAGFVTFILDDKSGRHSDSKVDAEAFLKGIGLPYENADLKTLDRQIARLFAYSETQRLPYALLVDADTILQPVDSVSNLTIGPPPQYQRDIVQHILCPFFVDYQNEVLHQKLNKQEWRSIPRPAMPVLPQSLPEKWKPLVAQYSSLFAVFKSVRGSLVTGDTGVSSLFACPPFDCVDITTYLGGSLPLAIGAYLAGRSDAWAITGDFSFIGAGHLGLIEARQRQIPLKVLILSNGKAETTGGQPIPPGILESLLSAYQENVSYIRHPQDPGETEMVLRQAAQSDRISIVIADYTQV